MEFYSRERELELLENQYNQVNSKSIMTVITGRRRIGKTSLAKRFSQDKRSLYLFISKKDEVLLCEEFIERIKDEFSFPVIGEIKRFKDVFTLVLELAIQEKFVLIVDEFQEFFQINKSVYSDIQNLWDQYRLKSNLHLIFIGSVYSLMHKIFKNNKEPLFGRADRVLYLKPFTPRVLKQILQDNNKYCEHNLFMNYLLTGGVPRYQEILLDNMKYTKDEIIEFYLEIDSPFIEEGRTILIEEFGKEYGTYFSILELLSEGRTSRNEIESILEKNIGGYLEKLIADYDIVGKVKPIGSKPTGRIQKYYIRDNFIKFWFRFVYKYRSAIENNNHEYIRMKIDSDIDTYSGPILEKLYHDIYRDSGNYTEIGSYWEKGNQNEIDLVCIDEMNMQITIAEIKLNKNKIKVNRLKEKASELIKRFAGYKIQFLGLSITDLDRIIEMNKPA